MNSKRNKFFLMLAVIISFPVLLFGAGGQEDTSEITEMKPEETLVISGVEWGPPANFNPLDASGHVAGKYQLVYENLYHYDLQKGSLKPWLAEEEGQWVTENEYVVKLRKGIKFNDGEDFTADDVVFTFNAGKTLAVVEWHSMWEWTNSIEKVDSHTVKFVFKKPRYHEFLTLLYRVPILPEHIWSKYSDDEKLQVTNEECIATGAYTFGKALDDKMIWARNDAWWGNDVFGAPAPKYIVLQVVFDNNVGLGMVMKGELDVCNNYLPGLEKIKDSYGLTTYYDGEPYNRSANVAMLYMNNQKTPMDKASFRKAVAYAINPDLIVNNVYGGQVKKANPIGFMDFDFWMQYYDAPTVDKYGFSYDPMKAKALLDEAGIKDIDGDGFREDSDGSSIDLKIIVPSGWTDWMLSIQMISKSLAAVGVKVTPSYPDFGLYWEELSGGSFDMAINNFNSLLSPTPWTFWNCVAYDQLDRESTTFGNYGKYKNDELFSLIDKFNETPVGSDEGKSIAAQIQKIYLEEMPNIPVWYNGFWSAASTKHWVGWPSEKENSEGIATGYAYYYSLGAYEMILNLKPRQ